MSRPFDTSRLPRLALSFRPAPRQLPIPQKRPICAKHDPFLSAIYTRFAIHNFTHLLYFVVAVYVLAKYTQGWRV